MHGLFYTPTAEEVRAFIRDKLSLAHNDIGEDWPHIRLARSRSRGSSKGVKSTNSFQEFVTEEKGKTIVRAKSVILLGTIISTDALAATY